MSTMDHLPTTPTSNKNVPVGYTPFLNLFVVIGDLSPCIKLVNIISSTGKTNMTSLTDLVRFQVSTTKTSLLVVHKQNS